MRGGRIVQMGPTPEVLASLTEEERAIMSRPEPSTVPPE
jgi:hypothetical protein